MAADFDLAAVRESIVAVLQEECSGAAVHAHIDGREALDVRLWRLGSELGWLALAPPEAHGGLGLGAEGLALLHFELGRASAPAAFLATSVAIALLGRAAEEGGAPIAGLVADAIGGAASLAIAAQPGMDGPTAGWLLGEADAAAALIAGTGDDMLLVDVASGEPERVASWDETRSLVALRARPRTIATLSGARPLFDAVFALALAADSAGAARGTLDRTIAYMKEREQFGRPIGSFQALKHRAADHSVRALIAEQHVAQAAAHLDGPGLAIWPAMAKANATEAATAIAGDCVQLHGGVGFTREYDPHLYLKRVRLNEMLLAPNTVLRDRAGRALAAAVRDDVDVLEIAR